jgi:hypothetical protein
MKNDTDPTRADRNDQARYDGSTKVVPGPKRFCLTRVIKGPTVRWSFAVRYFEKGRKVEEEHSAETEVEIENRRVIVVGKLRDKGMILCDCGCEFMTGDPHG